MADPIPAKDTPAPSAASVPYTEGIEIKEAQLKSIEDMPLIEQAHRTVTEEGIQEVLLRTPPQPVIKPPAAAFAPTQPPLLHGQYPQLLLALPFTSSTQVVTELPQPPHEEGDFDLCILI